MKSKAIQIFTYIACSMFSAAVYGVFAYFVLYKTLAGGIMLNMYLWNIGFIILILVLDKLINDVLLSNDFVINKNNYFTVILVHTVSFISYKTTLYLFYTFILIVSSISALKPDIISAYLRSFALSIEYCLVLVVAFDNFIGNLTKDNRRIIKIAEKLEKFSKFISAKQTRKKASDALSNNKQFSFEGEKTT